LLRHRFLCSALQLRFIQRKKDKEKKQSHPFDEKKSRAMRKTEKGMQPIFLYFAPAPSKELTSNNMNEPQICSPTSPHSCCTVNTSLLAQPSSC
jgi:hypothetical protein